MLQGFYWNSQKLTGWTQLADYAGRIGEDFTGIWLPPSASAEGGGAVGGTNVGYHPREWNDQTSCWGTADDLRQLITALHGKGVKVIADIVINHRAGDTDWGNFTRDDFGTYGNYQLTAANICSDDEMNTDPAAGKWNGMATGAPDTGENWNGARAHDHTSALVPQDCEADLAWLKGEYGYDGWRYDYCKGFDGSYVGLYNRASQPWLSVGEYWDGDYDKVTAWITATGRQSMAFDFPAKYAALNNGLAVGDYAAMAWQENGATWRPAGLIHHGDYNRYAVTFVDNHDTYRDNNKYKGDVPQAYAFLMASPGVPCVFWPHWTQYRRFISPQIAARHVAGLHSQSEVTVTHRDAYYESVSTGLRGTLVCRIGAAAPADVPEGYFLACSGTGWQYFLSDNLTGVGGVSVGRQPEITADGGVLTITAAQPTAVNVTAADGRVVVSGSHVTTLRRKLPAGIYVVKAGNSVSKVLLR